MSAGRDLDFFEDRDWETTGRCAIVSIYEDFAGRDLLLKLCNSLSRQFKNEVQFEFDWCRFKFLEDPQIALEAANSASRADLILLAPKSPELPRYVQGWFDDWLPKRDGGDGALVLVQPSPGNAAGSLPLQSYLRQTAKRAHLDYMRLRHSWGGARSLKKDTSSPWSQLQTEDFISHEQIPQHWGINE